MNLLPRRAAGVHVWRRMRAARLGFEWRLYQGRASVDLTIAHPRIHKWWATHLHLWVRVPARHTAKYRGKVLSWY